MSADSAVFSALAKTGSALGKGLIAGFAGTLAITVSQMIEMKITKRSMSQAPAQIGGKVLGVEPRGKAEVEKEKAKSENNEATDEAKEQEESNKQEFNMLMHWGYGTGWGVMRSALDLAGLQGLPASLLHFGGIWGAAQLMLPAAGVSKPITDWSARQIAIDVFHHAVYACAAGYVYDAMVQAERPRKFWKFLS